MWDFFKTKLGRILGTLLGFVGAGFIGALVGFIIGAVIDKLHLDGAFLLDSGSNTKNKNPIDFIMSSMVLAAAVIKSDGEKDELEINFIRNFLYEQYGNKSMQDYMPIFERAIKQDWDIRKVTQQIRQTNNYETCLQILYFLFGLANADYKINEKEIANIKIISIHLGISAEDHESIKAMFSSEIDANYKILDLLPSASDAEIKEAYRKLANKYHPDKIAHLGLTVSTVAQEKFQKVQSAYDSLKVKRGIK